MYWHRAECASINPVRSIWPFVPSSAPNLSSPYLVENHQRYKSRDERETFDENTRVNSEDAAASLAVTGGNKNGADWGTERSESLPSPTGRFDRLVPLMFHPSALPSTTSRHFDHLLPSLVNMSGPSFGQRAIALTTSSCPFSATVVSLR